MPIQGKGRKTFGPQRLDARNFLKGVNFSDPPMLIKPTWATNSKAVRMRYHEISSSFGRTQLGSTIDGDVQLVSRIMKFAGTEYNAVVTTDGLYKWSAGDWVSIREVYDTGDVDVTNGSTTVSGNGTSWEDFVHSGDDIDIDGVDYVVDSVTNDTTLELTSSYTGTTDTNVNYSIGLHLQGDLDYPANNCFGLDNWVFTNGVDWVKMFDGTDLKTITGASSYQTDDYHKAEIVRFFGDSLVLLNTTEDGNNVYQRVRWSDIGYLETWSNDNFQDLVNTSGKIIGAEVMGNDLIVYKNDEVVRMRILGTWQGFGFTSVASGIGLLARNSLIRVGDAHFFLGESWNQGYNIFLNMNGKVIPIGNPIRKELQRESSREYYHRAWALWNDFEEVVMFFVPTTDSGGICDRCWIYEMEGGNLKDGRWWKDDITSTGGGTLTRDSAKTIGELEGTIEEQDWLLGYGGFGVGGTMFCLGNDDGEVVEVDATSKEDEDGNTLEQFVESKEFNSVDIDAPDDTYIRSTGAEVIAGGALILKGSTDGGGTWEELGSVDTDGEERSRIDFDLTGPTLMFRIENTDTNDKFVLERWLINLQSMGRRN